MPFPPEHFDEACLRFDHEVDRQANGFLRGREQLRDRKRLRRLFDSGWDYLENNRERFAGLEKEEVRPYLEAHLRGDRENFGFPIALLLIGFKAILVLIELWLLYHGEESTG